MQRCFLHVLGSSKASALLPTTTARYLRSYRWHLRCTVNVSNAMGATPTARAAKPQLETKSCTLCVEGYWLVVATRSNRDRQTVISSPRKGKRAIKCHG
jgi:hypothetical protein